ncbi:PROTEIN putative-RELATED [Salix koriyanagi]|uniref:PROTEIN putative-RELATED n=1 Tax=Salix koriyanagi TaxID=2511006 RepID=A0A9Q0Z5R7_9ROSI|nr:PROTEIN putative-RELATED [Salix koriyanagi]
MLFPCFCSWVLYLVLFFSLILWGASKQQKPMIAMKSVTFEQFRIQAGSDSTGVATDMISVNSTVRMTYRNKGTFFGVHVTSTPLDLSYSEITLASGSIKKFYQSRKSQRSVAISLISDKDTIIREWGRVEQLNRDDYTTSGPKIELRC